LEDKQQLSLSLKLYTALLWAQRQRVTVKVIGPGRQPAVRESAVNDGYIARSGRIHVCDVDTKGNEMTAVLLQAEKA
jgi:hypothetical protein